MAHTSSDIGSRLQHAREQRGLSLRDIADVTKISTTALRAIEQNDFARLPEGLFRRAYIRAFAVEVGLNADALAREYRATFEADGALDAAPLPEGSGRARSQTVRRMAAASLAGSVLLIGGLLISNLSQRPHLLADEQATRNTVEDADQPEIALANAAVVDADEPLLRLDIRTKRPCWVSAVADGELIVYRLMQSGEQALIEATNSLTLRVGDASALDYSINGTRGRRLGGPGEVITVRFTAENIDRYTDPTNAMPAESEALDHPAKRS